MKILLTNATLVTLYPATLRTGHVMIEGQHIAAVSSTRPDGVVDHVLDCTGKLVVPGNVCAHTHLYSALARGMPGPSVTPANFREILQRIWWRLDRALDEPAIRSSALIGALDALRAGTTTLIDHHASPNSIEGSLDVLAGGLEEVGIRGVLCYEVTDRGGRERRDRGLRENDRFLQKNARSLIRGNVGAHASFTLEDDSLAELAELAHHHGTGVHVHVAEDAWDEVDAVRRSGQRAAVRLADAGILGEHSIAAHGVHLDEQELAVVQQHASWLVHNCRSNMNNRVGFAPVAHFGTKSALGTDGIDGDLFAESRTAFFRARENSLDADAADSTRRLAGGASLAASYFGARMGCFEPGALADLLVLDYDAPTDLTANNFAWHWMFALTSAHVESVMVGGTWIMKQREIIGIDEAKLRAEARVQASRLWERMELL